MADQKTVNKVKELLEGHCYAPLKEAAEKWLEAADMKLDDATEELAETELVKQLKEGVASVSEVIDTFGSEIGEKIVGSKEVAEKIKQHAEALKAEGKSFCDCEACTKSREILKDLGEDIGE